MSPTTPRGWSRSTAVAAGLGTVFWYLAGATPAWAHAGHRIAAGSGPWSVSVGVPAARAVLVIGAVPLAGLLLAPLLGGPVPRARRRVWLLRAGAVTGAGAGLLLGLWAPSPGWVPAGALVVSALVPGLAGSGRRADTALGAVVLVGALLVEPAHGAQLVAGVVHLVAAALWVGVVLQVALLCDRGTVAHRAARLHRPAVALTAAVVLSGGADACLHLPGAASLAASGYGRLVLAKLALVGAAALLGWAGHGRAAGPRAATARAWFRREAGGLVGAAVLAGALLLAPLPVIAAPGQVAFGTAVGAGGDVTVVAVPTPAPGGGQLVFVGFGGGAPASEGAAPVILVGRAGSSPDWVPARPLGAGRYVARMAGGGAGLSGVRVRLGRQYLDVRLSGAGAARPGETPRPDAITLDAVLGRLSALAVTAALEPPAPLDHPVQDRAQGAALAAYLLSHGVRSVGVAVDAGDARSSAFSAGLRGAFPGAVGGSDGARDGLPAGSALVLAGDPAQAIAVIDAARRRGGAPGGIILAPWLLDRPVMDDAIRGGSAVSLAADADPTGPVALEFLSAEGRTTPGFPPTYDGLAAFADALGPAHQFGGAGGRDGAAGFRLYAATAVQFLPAVLSDHNHGVEGWFSAGGQLVPVTPPLG